MKKQKGIFLLSFLVYTFCITICLSLFTPVLYKSYVQLVTICNKLRIHIQIKNLLYLLSHDIQNAIGTITIDDFGKKLIIPYKKKFKKWIFTNNCIYITSGKKRYLALQKVQHCSFSLHDNYSITITINTEYTKYKETIHQYVGMAI